VTIFSLLALVFVALLRADVIDEAASLQNVFDEALLDIYGERWSPAIGDNLQAARGQFAAVLTDSEARDLWNAPLPPPASGPLAATEALGSMQARQQHVAALEMISNQRAGNLDSAREWRSIIMLPKFANSVEGALALQRLGANPTQRDKEQVACERIRHLADHALGKTDALMRLIHEIGPRQACANF
jgi:high-affinity iron transporter